MTKVRIYKDKDFGGSYQELGPGRHSWITIGNDELTSVEVPPGWKVTLWWDANFSGRSLILTSSDAYVGSDWNDETTTVAVSCPVSEAPLDTPGSLALLGTGAYVDLGPVAIAPQPGSFQGFTVEAWVCFDSAGSWARIADLFQSLGADNITLCRYGTSSSIYFGIYKAGVEKYLLASNVITNSQWIHVAAAVDAAGNASIFCNGVEKASGKLHAPDPLVRSNSYAGRSGGTTGFLAGQLAELRLWSIARTAAEIRRLMNSRLTGTEQGLLRYLRLDESAGTIARDLCGSRDATIVLTTASTGGVLYGLAGPTLRDAAALPTGMQLDGSRDYLILPALATDFSGGFTLEAWVYVDDAASGARILELAAGAGSDSIVLGRAGTSGDMYCAVNVGTSAGGSISATGVLSTRTWMHLAATLSPTAAGATTGTLTLYVNGVNRASGQCPVPRSVSRTSSFIGKSSGAGDALFKGRLAEVRLWNLARAQDDLLAGLRAPISGEEAGLVAYYRLNESGETVAHDASPSRLHAQLADGLRWRQPLSTAFITHAPPAQALLLDGRSSYVALPALDDDFSRGFTIEAWVYFDDSTSSARIVDLGQGPAADNILVARAEATSDLSLHVYARRFGELRAPGVITNGTWMHVAVTMGVAAAGASTATATIYINGVSKASGLVPVPRSGIPRTRCFIGKSNWSANALFRGRIAEVRLWTVARTETQIRGAMNRTLAEGEARPARYFALDEGAGTLAFDRTAPSSEARAGRIEGSPLRQLALPPRTTAGAIGLDGVDDSVELPPLDDDLSRGFTIEAWVYLDPGSGSARIVELGQGVDAIALERDGASNRLKLLVGAAAEPILSEPVALTGRWTHVAATLSASGTAVLYVDGRSAGTKTGVPLPRAQVTRSPCYAGRGSSGAALRGRLADLRIWTLPRAAADVVEGMTTAPSGSEPGLCRFYPLDEAAGSSARDRAHKDGRLAVGAEWTALPHRTSLSFEGSGTYVQLPAFSDDFSQGLTIEAWVLFTSTASWARIVDLGRGTALDNIMLCRYGTSTQLNLRIYNGTSYSQLCTEEGTIPLGRWIHVAATVDANRQATIYVDGEIQITQKLSYMPASAVTRSSAYLGKSNWSQDSLLEGRLSEVRIFTVCRSQQDIQASMRRPLTGSEARLCRYYRLDEGPGTTARDSGPGAAHAKVCGPFVRPAMAFDGTYDAVRLPALSGSLSSKGFTLEAWVYPTAFRWWGRILELATKPGLGAYNISLSTCEGLPDVALRFFRDSTGGPSSVLTAAGALQLNTWTHIAVTFTAATWDAAASDWYGQATIYVNGQLRVSARVRAPYDANRTSSLIGKLDGYQPGEYMFQGRIAEVRIWQSARTQAQILGAMDTLLAGSEAGLLRYYRLSDPAGATVKDSVTASPVPATVLGASSRSGLAFNGSTNYVALPALSADFSGGLTIQAWVYVTRVDKHARIVDLGSGQGAENIILSRHDTSDRLLLVVYSGSSYSQLASGSALVLGQWTHVAVTLSPSGAVAFYVNGAAAGTGTLTLLPKSGITRPLCYLGKSNWSVDPLFSGRMSEVALFSRARTAAEITSSMGSGLSGSEAGLLGYYRLDGGPGLTIVDSSVSGARSGLLFGAQVDSSALRPDACALCFDGLQGAVELPAQTADLSRGFTLEAWACFTGTPKSNEALACLGGGNFGDTITLRRVNTSSDLVLTFAQGATESTFTFEAVLRSEVFMHLGVTVSAAAGSAGTWHATLYLNGAAVRSGPMSTRAALPAVAASRLGMSWDGSGPLSGQLAELRLWNRPRSALEIAGSLSVRARGNEPGLLRYYPLGEFWGRTARDVVAHPPALLSGSPVRFARPLGFPLPPLPGGALELDGVSLYVALPMITADLSAGFTIEAWVYFDGVEGGARIIELGRGDLDEVIGFGRTGSGLTLEVCCDGLYSRVTTSSGVIADRIWTHVAACAGASGTATIFVNGGIVASGTVLLPAAGVSRAKAYLGKGSGPATLLKGRLAEVRLWSRARTAEEIRSQKDLSLWRDDASLLACYRLDESEGTVAHDASRAGRDAVIKGQKPVWGAPVPQLLPAPHGPGALSFDGTSDWVALPTLPASFSDGFTLEAWVCFADNANMARILDLGAGAGSDNILLARAQTSTDLILQVYIGSTGPTEVRAAGVLQVGTWMHIAAVCSATGAAALYVNGVSRGSGTIPLPRSIPRTSSFIGRSNWATDALFRGRMAEVRLWSSARPLAEIKRTMAMRLRGSEPGLIACYRLNEYDGERAGDSSKSGLHAWARGTASWDRGAPLPAFVPAADPPGVLRLDGATAVRIPALAPSPNQIGPAGLCLEAFVYCAEVTQPARFIDLGNSATASDNVYLGKAGSDLVLGVQIGTAPAQVVTAKAVLAGQQWIHVAASIDQNGHVILCKNGTPVAADRRTITPPAEVLRKDATIGRSLSGAMFNGRMTEVRIFTTPRTPRQIAEARFVRLGSEIPGLARCYPLLAPRGAVAADTAPMHLDGSVQGASIVWDITGPDLSGSLPAPADVPPAGALAFDGASTYVRLPAVSTDLSRGFTIEAWAYFLGRESWARIVDIGEGAGVHNILLARYGTTDRLALCVFTTGGVHTDCITPSSVLPLGRWVHLAATVAADGKVTIYVDGASVSVSPFQIAATAMPAAGITRSRVYLGKSNWDVDGMFRGRLAEVRLWNRTRTAEEIQSSRGMRLTGTERGLFGYYRLDEQRGRSAASRSTLLGSAGVFGDIAWGAAAPTLAAEPPMPVPAQPPTTPPPSGALTVPSGPSTGWGAGITTGDSLVDTAITTYAQTGISFDLFGVTTALKLGGSISFVPLSKTVSVTGTLTLTRPAALPSVTGTVTINRGTSPAVYSARFKPAFSVSQMVHDAAAGTAAAGAVDALLVPPLRAFDGCTIIVASDEGYDSDLGDFGKGINFYVSQKVSDLPGISLLPDKWKIDLLHLDERLLVFAIGVRSPTEYRFSGRAQLDVPLIPGSDFRLTFNEIGLNTLVSPTSSSFGIAHRFTLNLLGESLVFQGGISVEKGSTGEDVVVWGALDPDANASPDGMWHRPFGCPGITIEGLGLQIKLADRPPFLGIGVRGGVHIGDGLLGASLALNVDPANVDNTILMIASPEGLDLPRLINAVLDVTQIPGLGILSELFDVRFKDLELYFAPNGGTIANKDYEPGISLSATLDLWGYHASLFGRLDSRSGGTLKGEADRIKLDVGSLTLLQISDVSGQKGPSVDIALNTSRQGVFYSGRLVLLGGVYDKYQELAITASGLYFKTGTAMGDLELTCKSSGADLTVWPRFVFGFNVLGLSVHIDIGGVIANRVDSSGYVQSLTFGFHVCGLDFAVGPVTWGITLTDLGSVLRVFEHFFGDMVKSFFTDALGRAFKEAFEWVKNNLTDLAEEAIELFKSAGAAVADIAKNVFETYEVAVEELIGYLGTGLDEAAAILKGILSDVTEAAEVLGAVFGEAAGAVKAALSNVGYDVARVAGDVWDAIDDAAGYIDPTSW